MLVFYPRTDIIFTLLADGLVVLSSNNCIGYVCVPTIIPTMYFTILSKPKPNLSSTQPNLNNCSWFNINKTQVESVQLGKTLD